MGKLISFFILIILASCSNQIRIYDQFSPNYDFYANRLYIWYEESGSMPEISFFSNPITDKKMKEIITEQMESRGYTLSTTPSSLIFHHYILMSQPLLSLHPGTFAGQSGNPHVVSPAKISATLILYLVDPLTDQVVWRGYTMHELQNPIQRDEEETVEHINRLLEDLIPAIFTRYPINPT